MASRIAAALCYLIREFHSLDRIEGWQWSEAFSSVGSEPEQSHVDDCDLSIEALNSLAQNQLNQLTKSQWLSLGL